MFDRTHRALSHPVRARILALLNERGEASPSELAAWLGGSMSLEAVSYHVRTLVRAEMIELVRTSQPRGAVQRHYRARESGTVAVRVALDEARAEELERAVRALVARADDAGDAAGDAGDAAGDAGADSAGEAAGDAGADDLVEVTVVVHRAAAQS